jgi:dipeptidyl aminopeptidase/acylaminoacyl peptidase
MQQEAVSIPSSSGMLAGVIHHPRRESKGYIITSHGLLSNKDSDKFIALGERFAEEGFTVLRFDFGGCGRSEGTIADTTVTGRKEDLLAALAFMQRRLSGSAQPIGLLGSSMGGFVSLLVASCRDEIKAVAAWATPFCFEELRKGITHSSGDIIKDGFFDDARLYAAESFVPRVRNLLIIHGDGDETVPLHHARRLYDQAREPRHLEIIPGADHSITAPEHREKAVAVSLEWFKKWVIRG